MSNISSLEYTAPWSLYALAWSSSSSSSAASSSSSSSRWSERRGSYHHSSSSGSSLPRDSRLAVGSFVDEYSNRIQVLGVGNDEYGHPALSVLADAAHPYPATKIAFQPSTLDEGNISNRYSSSSRSSKGNSYNASHGMQGNDDFADDEAQYPDRELLATTADCLRVWECMREDDDGKVGGYVGQRGQKKNSYGLREKSVLAHSKNTTSPAPLTSFSWNTPSPNLIVTSSIDTTCTIWDLPSRTALTQLIAHDREVYDVDWCPGSSDVFASVGADGSVRVFDLRSLEHSTIIYETGNPAPTSGSSGGGGNNGDGSRPGSAMSNNVLATPLLRIAFNPWDANYLATFHLDSESVQILDVRAPGSPILELRGHQGSVNAVAWGPPSKGGPSASKGMICSSGDDCQCLVYDLASSTLRSASAQGRRSRNGAGPSPAPSNSTDGISASSSFASTAGIGAEVPILAYTAAEPVNNVAWLRLPTQSSNTSGKSAMVQEWDDYTAGARKTQSSDVDWLALISGRTVRALRV